MKENEKFLYHSVLSVYLNIGLLNPREVIQKVLQSKDLPIESIEGFVRQIVGWREYVRGIYWHYMPKYSQTNFFNAKNKLPDFYWTGETKMNCMKNAVLIKQKKKHMHIIFKD